MAPVEYREDDRSVVIVGTGGRVIARAQVMPAHPPLAVEGRVFCWNGRRFDIATDELDLAEAFVEHVNSRDAAAPVLRGPANQLSQPLEGGARWQYAVVDVGIVSTGRRMAEVLWSAGVGGWELVHVVDKTSNWVTNLEKGFMVFRRPVPEDVKVQEWCVNITNWT